jgi:transposase
LGDLGDHRGMAGGVVIAGVGECRAVAVRLGGDRREADRHQHGFALVDHRQPSFHASSPLIEGDDREENNDMDNDMAGQIALHRWAVIAEATAERLSPAERGAVVRAIAQRAHTHPDGSSRRYSRGTIDRWIRAWRAGGLEALRPSTRSDAGTVRAHPELAEEAVALRLELPSRSAAQIATILFHRHGVAVSQRTVRDQLRRRGLHREALEAERKVFGRYEAARANERWITDVLVDRGFPTPRLTPRCGPSCF